MVELQKKYQLYVDSFKNTAKLITDKVEANKKKIPKVKQQVVLPPFIVSGDWTDDLVEVSHALEDAFSSLSDPFICEAKLHQLNGATRVLYEKLSAVDSFVKKLDVEDLSEGGMEEEGFNLIKSAVSLGKSVEKTVVSEAKTVGSAVVSTANTVVNEVKSVANTVMEGLDIGDAIKAPFEDIKNKLEGFFNKIKDSMEAIGKTIERVFNDVVAKMEEVAKKVVTEMTSLFGKVIKLFEDFWNLIKPILEFVWNLIKFIFKVLEELTLFSVWFVTKFLTNLWKVYLVVPVLAFVLYFVLVTYLRGLTNTEQGILPFAVVVWVVPVLVVNQLDLLLKLQDIFILFILSIFMNKYARSLFKIDESSDAYKTYKELFDGNTPTSAQVIKAFDTCMIHVVQRPVEALIYLSLTMLAIKYFFIEVPARVVAYGWQRATGLYATEFGPD